MKIEFGEIISKTITVPYNSIEVDGYKVSGYATYNKDNRLTDARGDVKTAEDVHIGSFNVYGIGEDRRINLNDCTADKMNDVAMVSDETIASLSATYPRE